jgi:hypothetical protein
MSLSYTSFHAERDKLTGLICAAEGPPVGVGVECKVGAFCPFIAAIRRVLYLVLNQSQLYGISFFYSVVKLHVFVFVGISYGIVTEF